MKMRNWLLTGALLLLLLAGAAGVALQPPGQALASAQPLHISAPALPSPPTPGQPPTLPKPPTNARSVAALPSGVGQQQTQILGELGHPDKALLVSIADQTLYIYQGGTLLTWSYITTGRPGSTTPRGFYSVLQAPAERHVLFPLAGQQPQLLFPRLPLHFRRLALLWRRLLPARLQPALATMGLAPTSGIRTPMAPGKPARMAASKCRSPLYSGSITG